MATLLQRANSIPLKYVLIGNLTLLFIAATIASVTRLNQTTDYRSQAKEMALPTPVSFITIDPTAKPVLSHAEPSWAKPGDAVLVRGENLGTIPFGRLSCGQQDIPTENLVDWQPGFIVFTLPTDSSGGPISLSVTTPSGSYTTKTSTSLEITSVNQE